MTQTYASAANASGTAAGQSDRSAHIRTLIDVTSIPTAAGCEHRVVAYIRDWVARRPELSLTTDPAGNLVVAFTGACASQPLFITAHMDHPAFVIERIVAPGVVELSFRGGVMDIFFQNAPITIYTRDNRIAHATLTGECNTRSAAGKHYLADVHLDDEPGAVAMKDLNVGDVATWLLDPAEVDAQGVLHTPACDDLAALAAALAAMDDLVAARRGGEQIGDVRLLFTRAEEVGFVGAIAACKHQTMPRGSRIIALENSRAFSESPVGGGPIVRVGDRLSVFTPWLTGACAQRAEEIFGGPSAPVASQRAGSHNSRAWQRKLMAGGACEASVFCTFGYDATCLCLPLGNYHNMPHLAELQAGTYDHAKFGPPRAAREFIHTADYLGLVDLLVALARKLPDGNTAFAARLERMVSELAYLIKEPC